MAKRKKPVDPKPMDEEVTDAEAGAAPSQPPETLEATPTPVQPTHFPPIKKGPRPPQKMARWNDAREERKHKK